MLFNSSVFAVFLAVVLTVHWALASRRARNLFLLGASYLFYGWWDWRFLLLLIGSSTIDFFAGIAIHDTTHAQRRKAYLFVSCGVNIATLVLFKYFNFFSDNLRLVFETIGLHMSWPVLRIILPVGVSFYTLQAMTYTIDVYRRTMPACRDYPDFLLFVAYFPQLVAGPISRACNLLPQIQSTRRFDAVLASRAIPYIVVGYLLKTVVADNLSAVVTGALANVGAHSGFELVLVAYSALFEIYGDFAGYTYIALGISMLFGIVLPQNFRSPFLSQSVREFWTRWHISLMSWFREYVFFTMVKRRGSPARMRAATVLTFGVSGLWHGASWPYVTWGFLNGFEYYIPRPFSTHRAVGRVLNAFVTFNLVAFTWMVFRLHRVSDALVVAQRLVMNFLPSGGAGEPGGAELLDVYWWRFAIMAGVAAFEIAQRNAQDLPQIYGWRAPVRYAFYAAVAMIYFYRGNFSRIPFIYFQF